MVDTLQRDWDVQQFNVSTAYLNDPFGQKIYAEEDRLRIGAIFLLLFCGNMVYLGAGLRGDDWVSYDHYIWAIAARYLAFHVDGLAIAVLKHCTGTTFIKSNFKIHDL